VKMSKQSDVQGSAGSYSARPTPVLHRPFEDADTQQQIQRSMITHQFHPRFSDVDAPRSMCVDRPRAGPLHDALPPGPAPRVHQLADDRAFIAARSMTSAGDEMDDADDDDDDVVDSATGNITSNTTTINGQWQLSLVSSHRSLLEFLTLSCFLLLI